METYYLLREIDKIRGAVDNLYREAVPMMVGETRGISEIPVRDESIKGLISEQVYRIDAVAYMINKYFEATKTQKALSHNK